MADFKFLGDPKAMGKPIIKIRCRCSGGCCEDYLPPNPHTEWEVDDVLTVSCSGCTRYLQADTRFEQQ